MGAFQTKDPEPDYQEMIKDLPEWSSRGPRKFKLRVANGNVNKLQIAGNFYFMVSPENKQNY